MHSLRIYTAIAKALCVVLALAILGVGGYAMHMTKLHAIVTVQFGEAPPQTFAVADAIDMRQFAPLPIPSRKPRVTK